MLIPSSNECWWKWYKFFLPLFAFPHPQISSSLPLLVRSFIIMWSQVMRNENCCHRFFSLPSSTIPFQVLEKKSKWMKSEKRNWYSEIFMPRLMLGIILMMFRAGVCKYIIKMCECDIFEGFLPFSCRFAHWVKFSHITFALVRLTCKHFQEFRAWINSFRWNYTSLSIISLYVIKPYANTSKSFHLSMQICW